MRGGHKTAHPSELSVLGHAVKIAGMRDVEFRVLPNGLRTSILMLISDIDVNNINREFLKRPLH